MKESFTKDRSEFNLEFLPVTKEIRFEHEGKFIYSDMELPTDAINIVLSPKLYFENPATANNFYEKYLYERLTKEALFFTSGKGFSAVPNCSTIEEKISSLRNEYNHLQLKLSFNKPNSGKELMISSPEEFSKHIQVKVVYQQSSEKAIEEVDDYFFGEISDKPVKVTVPTRTPFFVVTYLAEDAGKERTVEVPIKYFPSGDFLHLKMSGRDRYKPEKAAELLEEEMLLHKIADDFNNQRDLPDEIQAHLQEMVKKSIQFYTEYYINNDVSNNRQRLNELRQQINFLQEKRFVPIDVFILDSAKPLSEFDKEHIKAQQKKLDDDIQVQDRNGTFLELKDEVSELFDVYIGTWKYKEYLKYGLTDEEADEIRRDKGTFFDFCKNMESFRINAFTTSERGGAKDESWKEDANYLFFRRKAYLQGQKVLEKLREIQQKSGGPAYINQAKNHRRYPEIGFVSEAYIPPPKTGKIPEKEDEVVMEEKELLSRIANITIKNRLFSVLVHQLDRSGISAAAPVVKKFGNFLSDFSNLKRKVDADSSQSSHGKAVIDIERRVGRISEDIFNVLKRDSSMVDRFVTAIERASVLSQELGLILEEKSLHAFDASVIKQLVMHSDQNLTDDELGALLIDHS